MRSKILFNIIFNLRGASLLPYWIARRRLVESITTTGMKSGDNWEVSFLSTLGILILWRDFKPIHFPLNTPHFVEIDFVAQRHPSQSLSSLPGIIYLSVLETKSCSHHAREYLGVLKAQTTLDNKACRSCTRFPYLEEKSGSRSVHTRFPVCLHTWPSVGWHRACSPQHSRRSKEDQAPAKVELTRTAFTSAALPSQWAVSMGTVQICKVLPLWSLKTLFLGSGWRLAEAAGVDTSSSNAFWWRLLNLSLSGAPLCPIFSWTPCKQQRICENLFCK